jgi:hypothetical protein
MGRAGRLGSPGLGRSAAPTSYQGHNPMPVPTEAEFLEARRATITCVDHLIWLRSDLADYFPGPNALPAEPIGLEDQVRRYGDRISQVLATGRQAIRATDEYLLRVAKGPFDVAGVTGPSAQRVALKLAWILAAAIQTLGLRGTLEDPGYAKFMEADLGMLKSEIEAESGRAIERFCISASIKDMKPDPPAPPFLDLVLDNKTYTATRNGSARVVFDGRQLQWRLLVGLFEKAGTVLTYEEIAAIWGQYGGTDEPDSKTIQWNICAIRGDLVLQR